MDVSTQLVRAYLHVNGYFTTTEYPLVESRRAHPPRMRTDIDLMAVRFPRRRTFPDPLQRIAIRFLALLPTRPT